MVEKNEKKFKGGLKKIPNTIDKAITGCRNSSSLVKLEKAKMKSICKSVKSFGVKQYISRLEGCLGGKTDRRTAKLNQTATYKRCKFIDESLYKPDTEYYELELERFEEGKLVPKEQVNEFVAKMKEQHPAEKENEYTSSIVRKGYETDWVDITLPKVIKKEKLDRWKLPS